MLIITASRRSESLGLTRTSSATAGGSERSKFTEFFHKSNVRIGTASGWLERLVRPSWATKSGLSNSIERQSSGQQNKWGRSPLIQQGCRTRQERVLCCRTDSADRPRWISVRGDPVESSNDRTHRS